jgi:hypothetical protein
MLDEVEFALGVDVHRIGELRLISLDDVEAILVAKRRNFFDGLGIHKILLDIFVCKVMLFVLKKVKIALYKEKKVSVLYKMIQYFCCVSEFNLNYLYYYMEKLFRFLPAIFVVFALVSCNEEGQPADPFDVPNTELTPTALTLEGQVGSPVFVDSAENPDAGTVSVVIEIREVDVHSIVVEDIRVPRAAVASIARGDILDLSAGASFSVTAEDGSRRTYTIIYREPERAQGNSVLSFELDGQLGKTTITDDGEAGGLITMVLDPDEVDMSAVVVKNVSVSELASSNLQAGATVNLSSSQAEIVITSDAGIARTYVIRPILPLDSTDPVAGAFKMSSREVVENWGGTDNAIIVDGGASGQWYTISDKNWMWSSPDRAKNYSLKFLVTKEEAGSVSGTAVLTAPNDNWFNFIWDPNNDGTDVTDVYQIVPKGVSTFTKTGGEITFFVEGEEYGKTVMHGPSDPTGANPVTLISGSGQTLTIGKTKALKVGEGDTVLPDVYGLLTPRSISTPDAGGDKSIYVDNVRGVLWLIQKVN